MKKDIIDKSTDDYIYEKAPHQYTFHPTITKNATTRDLYEKKLKDKICYTDNKKLLLKPIVSIDVVLDNFKERIVVYTGDSANELAYNFGLKHSILNFNK